ncbi:MAG TPA: hypothetical protein HPQ00_16245 [Magnetococcales bacterium]|nr:hypothetical protein [Magnetococcales bacterium]
MDNVVNKFYNLASSGNLGILILTAVIVWCMLVTLRLPPEKIPWLLTGIYHFFQSCYWAMGLMLLYIVASTYAFAKSDKKQRQEIQRLTDERKKLTHGLENARLKTLEHHTSSGFDILEGK